MNKKLGIIFMGTPDFAVETLRVLIENDYNVVGVITSPDRPAGRGQKINESAVKKYAVEQGLTVLQPLKFKNEEFLAELKALNANLQIVVAFRMLPEVVWDMPEYGTFNLHASLLPQYRGAAPINWAIINGEKETGVTTFFINENIDTGAIIDQASLPINHNDSAGTLHDKMMNVGAELLLKTVNEIEAGLVKSKPQNISEEIKHAPKIFKQDTVIDFNLSAEQVYDFIRGLSPYPAAACTIIDDGNEYGLKIYETEIIHKADKALMAGNIDTDGKKYVHIRCKKGVLSLKTLQVAGKKRMNVTELLNGFKLNNSAKIG